MMLKPGHVSAVERWAVLLIASPPPLYASLAADDIEWLKNLITSWRSVEYSSLFLAGYGPITRPVTSSACAIPSPDKPRASD